MITATYRYYVDWNGDGDFSDSNENITGFVFEASWEYGRDYASQLNGRSKAGSCRLSLDNSDSRFSPFNVSSPIYGQMLPGRRIRITMQIGSESEVTMWQGFLESITPTVGPMVRVSTAELLAYGSLAHRSLQGQVSVPMHTDIKTGDAVTEVLDQAQFPAGDRVIDAGQGTMSRWWDQGSAIQALRDLEETEAGFLRETKDGKIAFEDRAHRLSGPHTISQATYGGGSLVLWNPQQGDSPKGIFNYIEAAVRSFDVSEEMVLWTLAGTPPAIAPGATLSIKGQFPNPTSQSGYLAVSEWTITDYQANSQADGGGSDLTEHVDAVATKSAIEILLEFTNNGTETAYLTLCRCHGIAVVESDPVKVWAEDDESRDRFGYLPYTNVGKFLTNIAEAQDRCDHFLAIYKDPVPIISFDLKANYDSAHLAEAKVRDVSDRITIKAGAPYGLYIDEDFFVEWIRHNVGRDKLHVMNLLCSSVVSHHWPASGTPYEPKVIPPPTTGGEPHVPDDIFETAAGSGLRVTFGAIAWKWNADISEAEFRAKLLTEGERPEYVDLRTASEGGTLAHNGADQLVMTGLQASYGGRNVQIKGMRRGRWYYSFRFKNGAGWSVWGDGNDVPKYVKHYVDTDDINKTDNGPPADWTGTIKAGPNPYTLIISATRPKENGNKIIAWGVQLHHKTFDKRHEFDANSDQAVVYYDGSAESHTYDKGKGEFTRLSGDFPDLSADPDLMILMDVRGGEPVETFSFGLIGKVESNLNRQASFQKSGSSILLDDYQEVAESMWHEPLMGFEDTHNGVPRFDVHHCQWGAISPSNISADKITGMGGFRPAFDPDENGVYQDVRLKIVKPPWIWKYVDGYFGEEPNRGWWTEEFWFNNPPYDDKTELFETKPVTYPSWMKIENVEARAIFENFYSRSDDDTWFDPAAPAAGTGGTILNPDADPVVIDCSLGRIFYLTMTKNHTLAKPINAKNGSAVCLVTTQDSIGGWTLSLDTKFHLGIDVISAVLTLAPGARDYMGSVYCEATDQFDVVSFVRGY